MKTTFLIALISISVLSNCNRISSNRIILTVGLSEDPSIPRFGIEITEHELFYCEEIVQSKGEYRYYHTKLEPEVFNSIIQEINNSFQNSFDTLQIVDGTPYELLYVYNQNNVKLVFFRDLLSERQNEIIHSIIKLKKTNMKRIKYHQFPERLLNEKLPPPPDPKKSSN